MNLFRWVGRSLFFYYRTWAGAVLLASISIAVVSGSLVIGESITGELKRQSDARLGGIRFLVQKSGGTFRRELAVELERELKIPCAAVLARGARLSKPGGRAILGDLYGVDSNFASLFAGHDSPEMPSLSMGAAEELESRRGEEIYLRVERSGDSYVESVLTPDKNAVAFAETVRETGGWNDYTRYLPRNEHLPSRAFFMPLDELQKTLDMADGANQVVLSSGSREEIAGALERLIQPEDAGIVLKQRDDDTVDLYPQGSGWFSPEIARVLNTIVEARAVTTHLIDSIENRDRVSPYAFVSAASNELKGNEVALSEWLAKDLKAEVGDSIRLVWRLPALNRKLIEREDTFVVRDIYALPSERADTGLAPNWEGLTDSESCSDWEGDWIDLKRVRDKDEKFWETYGPVPKALVSANRARELFGSDFGHVTSFRMRGVGLTEARRLVASKLGMQQAGLILRDLEAEAKTALKGTQDYSLLFVSFGFFLSLSALLLSSSVFVSLMEKRREEMGSMKSLGFGRRRLFVYMTVELMSLSLLAGVLGCLLGEIYAYGITFGLNTFWRDAVGPLGVRFQFQPMLLLAGALAGMTVTFVFLMFRARGLLKQGCVSLLRGEQRRSVPAGFQIPQRLAYSILFVLFLTMLFAGRMFRENPVWLFCFSGFCLLVALFCISRISVRAGQGIVASCFEDERRNKLMVLTALGTWIVGVIFFYATQMMFEKNTFTHHQVADFGSPVSGELKTGDGSIDWIRVADAERAGCSNLLRPSVPTVYGLPVREMLEKGRISGDPEPRRPFEELLNAETGRVFAVLADAPTLQWSLGKKVGDTILLPQAGGNTLLKIVGQTGRTIFQGGLMMSEPDFREAFPGVQGYKMALIQPGEGGEHYQDSDFAQNGGVVRGLEEKKRELYAVERSNMMLFASLGGLGLLFGVLGSAALAFQSVRANQMTLALLQCMGHSSDKLYRLFVSLMTIKVVGGAFLAVGVVLASLYSAGGDGSGRLLWVLAVVFIAVGLALLLLRRSIRLAWRGIDSGVLKRET